MSDEDVFLLLNVMNIQLIIINAETVIQIKLYLSLKQFSFLLSPPKIDERNNRKKAITGAVAKNKTPP